MPEADAVQPPVPGRRIDQVAMWLGPLVIAGLIAWMSFWTVEGRSHPEIAVAWVLITSLPYAGLWMAGALGLGWPLRRLLPIGCKEGLALQAGFGVAIMLFLDVTLGSAGILQWGGSIGAWVLLGIGLLLVLEQFRRWMGRTEKREVLLPWTLWVVSPAVAVLLLAACSAPGWLWTTEFGGYDALSYHLQLPREWLRAGFISPVDHNVYSHFPGFVEAAYYHLAVLGGDKIEFVYAAQLLHAGLTLLAATVVGRVGATLAGPRAGLAAGVIILGTPWVIVTGSLGYNDMVVVLMLTCGLLLLNVQLKDDRRLALLLGIVIGAACGAKLTAIGLVALPLVALALWGRPPGRALACAGVLGVTSLAMLSPSLIANAVDTGNPIFPFATGWFGTGHWTVEQAQIWTAGHAFEGGVITRIRAGFDQFIRYGLGPNPDSGEPWLPQWSVLPLLCMIVLSFLLPSRNWKATIARLGLLLLVQIVFWLTLTHVKSRFMLPAAVPMALLVGLGLGLIADRLASRGSRLMADGFLVVVLVAWCVQPVVGLARERNGYAAAMIDSVGFLSGADLDEIQRREQGLTESVAIHLNYLLGGDSQVLLIGHATPLYINREVTYQTTWDRGPMSEVMREYPDAPGQWIDALRDRGFTHLLVEPNMLRNWEAAGWNDPLITAERIQNAADLFATEVCRYPNGTRLFRLVRPSADAAP